MLVLARYQEFTVDTARARTSFPSDRALRPSGAFGFATSRLAQPASNTAAVAVRAIPDGMQILRAHQDNQILLRTRNRTYERTLVLVSVVYVRSSVRCLFVSQACLGRLTVKVVP